MNSMFRNLLLLLLIASLTYSCKESIFGPNSGNIDGTIYDDFGRPVRSVLLTTIVLDSNFSSISTSSDDNGAYQLLEVPLGTVQIQTKLKGYRDDIKSVHITQDENKGRLDFKLIGAPEILSTILDKDSASKQNNDTLRISLSTIDLYNSDNASYDLDISGIVKDENKTVVKIYDLQSQNSQQNQLFEIDILATELAVGKYTIDFIAYDEDNLQSPQKSVEFSISN